ncbi:MAG TPA: amino acid racemase [Pelomicrobium sp.]|nr:amino acid racemase [Pelomicrobium sp.]
MNDSYAIAQRPAPDRLLGVLGGMGPLAGAAFMTRLTQLTPATRDQEHIPAVLWSDPRVPDRTAALLGDGPSPLNHLLYGVERLVQAGATCIAIPCNTAHLWFEDLVRAVAVPFLHIVDATIDDLQRQGVRAGRVGVMGTAGTLKLRLYQERLEARGYECLLPTDEEVAALCMPAIALVKENRIAESYAPAATCVERLRERGAEAVLLGCTELPLALPSAARAAFGVPMSDSIDALAWAAIRWYAAAAASARSSAASASR